VIQLAEAMREIAGDAGLRSSMSRESANLIRNYSPESCAAGIAEATLAAEAFLNV